MSTAPAQYTVTGSSAASVVRSIERGVVSGQLSPGSAVPSVRALARQLEVSPTTVAAAYRDLRQRGVLVSHDRSRTVVGHRPPLTGRLAPVIPPGAVDLASGNPDPALLPDLAPALSTLAARDVTPRMYGTEAALPELLDRARLALAADGVPTDHLAVVGGGLDGIERVLEVHLRVGDRIAVEDPGYIGCLDLTRAMGLTPVPVAVDDDGPRPEALAEVLDRGVQALLLVPRAQNPLGAAVSADRAATLRTLLAEHPDVLVVEDDHTAAVAGPDLHPVAARDRERWAVVRSVAKGLGPDLRTAVLAADADTVARVLGRQRLGAGWVSHLLQRVTAELWTSAVEQGTLATAAAVYTQRREAVLEAFDARGLRAHGASGLNVWLPVEEEVPVVQGLLTRGWAVQAGEPFRLHSAPGIRITIAQLPVERAGVFASDVVDVLDRRLGTRRG